MTVSVIGWTRHGTVAETEYEMPVGMTADDIGAWLEEVAEDFWQITSFDLIVPVTIAISSDAN